MKFKTHPEVLAPAGTPEALQAALAAGADAVYFGSGPFHARSQAVSFPLEHLQETVGEIHRAGAKAYLTMNTLVLDGEWSQAWQVVQTAYEAGVDALIVQDVGLAASIHNLLPDLPLHASTQMALHNEAALEWAKTLGMSRVVLPRELSGKEIAQMTVYAHDLGLETEVFVQGALCVCYSGHCHMSRTLGGRSANRGACAQPCRHRYQLEGRDVEPIPLLSPKDLSYLHEIPYLQQAGVSSLKIEGRMRNPEYVAQAVRLYRKAIMGIEPEKHEEERLLQAFNRGGAFSNHRFYRTRGKSFLSGARSGNLGIFLGRSQNIEPQAGTLTFRLEGPAPDPGDTLVLRRSTGEDLASAPIARPKVRGDLCTITGFHPEKLRALPADTWIYRARSAQLQEEVRRLKRPEMLVTFILTAKGEQYSLRIEDEEGMWGEAKQESDPVEPLHEERLRQQLARLGGTGLKLVDLQLQVASAVSLRISSLNDLRRRAVADYQQRRMQVDRPVLDRRYQETWRSFEAIRSTRFHQCRASLFDCPSEKVFSLPGLRAGETPSLPEGSGLILPLSALVGGSEDWRLGLFRRYAVWVAVPSGAPLSLYESGRDAYSQWIREGLRGEWTCGLVTLGHIPGLLGLKVREASAQRVYLGDWYLFPDANVANAVTLQQYRDWGVTALALAQELEISAQQNLTAVDPSLCYLLFEGAQEVMLFEHCPVGYGESGCNRCQDKRQFTLQDERGREFPLVPLPEQGCSGRLYAAQEVPVRGGWKPEASPPHTLRVRILLPNDRCMRD